MHNSAGHEAVPGRLDALVGALLAATTPAERQQALCRLVLDAAGALGVAILVKNRNNQASRAETAFPAREPGDAPPPWLAELCEAHSQILAETPQSVVLATYPVSRYAIFMPLGKNEHSIMVLAALVAGGRPLRLQNVFDTLQMGRSLLFLSDQMTAPPAPTAGERTQDATPPEGNAGQSLQHVVDILGEVYPRTGFLEVGMALCAEAARVLGCERVALGVAARDQVRLAALDQMENFAKGSRSIRLLEACMQEALDQDRPVFYTAPLPGATPHGEQAPGPDSSHTYCHTRASAALLASSRAFAVYTLPLHAADGMRFVLLVELPGPPAPDFFAALSLIGRLAAPKLADVYAAQRPPLVRAWHWVLGRTADMFGPRRIALKLGLLVSGLLLATSLLFYGDITVHASTHIEGVYSYNHTAPMDSYLVEVNARPGDAVKKGDLLARLDDTELLREIDALHYQRDIYMSRFRQALQQGKTAEAEIVQLEAQRIAVNLRWAEERLLMTRLTSSVDGFIISEDLFPRLGQPVRRGQDLFEITDTADLRVVVRVDESDIPDINRARMAGNMHCVFTLTAYPDQRIGFAVERIHPFTSVEAGVNGFELRGRIIPGDADIFLRPGMEGHARLVCGRASLFSLATRKLANRIRMLWWSWV